jgi:hypothetical protein
MSALLPVWSHMAQREKEEELIFRGRQYARAIGLFQRKFANTAPPSIDVLVEQRFLRKKYKDPITGEDFQPVYANQQQGGPGQVQVAQRPGEEANQTVSTPAQQLQSGFNNAGGGARGGIIGVVSKSKDPSIKIYNGRDHYSDWTFVFVQSSQRPGESANLQGLPGQQGGRGGQPGQPQMPFGMQPGNMPGGLGGRGGQQPPPGFGVPNRPPVGPPGQNQPITPGQPRRPGQ